MRQKQGVPASASFVYMEGHHRFMHLIPVRSLRGSEIQMPDNTILPGCSFHKEGRFSDRDHIWFSVFFILFPYIC